MTGRGLGFSQATFDWFAGLEADNSKQWFDEHRDDFRTHVDEPFVRLLETVSSKLSGTELPLSGGPSTMFRMNRDVRFSADKSPYNPSRSGLLTPSGTKSETSGLVFIRVGASDGLLAGGLYKPAPQQLEVARQAILNRPDRFGRMAARLADEGYTLDRSDAVKTSPRGYSEHVDHPHFDAIRLKQYVVMQTLSPEEWLDDELAHRVAVFASAIAPLLQWAGAETSGPTR